MDVRDLEDTAFWSMIDSAFSGHLSTTSAAASALSGHLSTTSAAAGSGVSCHLSTTSAAPKPLLPPPSPSHHFQYRNPCKTRPNPELGEVVQQDKKPKIVHHQESIDRQIVVAANQAPPPVPPRPMNDAYASPGKRQVVVNQIGPLIESPSPNFEGKSRSRHSLVIGEFPSVAMFRQYQEMALQILDKSDYTMISGNPYIKKSGWRKMSFFFDISYEIKDKTIEYDQNQNVRRAEFLVRAHMQGGRYSDGWGSCEQREKRFNKPNHDIPSTAETRAKNKACQDLLGIGIGSKR